MNGRRTTSNFNYRRDNSPVPQSEPAPTPLLEISTLTAQAADSKTPRPHGKIARLPKLLRDQLNAMLDDGLPYRRIIEKLEQSTDPPLPYAISEMDLSRWKDSGYQRYLAQQERTAYVNANRDSAMDMVSGDDTTILPEAVLQIIASQYYDLFAAFSPDALQQKLADDPLKYSRFLNVFARLSREILQLKKHRQASAQQKVREQTKLDPDRELNQKERDRVWSGVERIFGFKPGKPIGPPLSELMGEMPSPNVNNASASEPPLAAAPLSPEIVSVPNPQPANDIPVSDAQPASTQQLPFQPAFPASAPLANSTTGPLTTVESEVLAIETQNSNIKNPCASSLSSSDGERAGVRGTCNQKSNISKVEDPTSHPTEYCPRCGTTLPPRLATGERPSPDCPSLRCGAHVRPPGTVDEPCPHCGTILPDLLPNGQRAAPTCPACQHPLPPPKNSVPP